MCSKARLLPLPELLQACLPAVFGAAPDHVLAEVFGQVTTAAGGSAAAAAAAADSSHVTADQARNLWEHLCLRRTLSDVERYGYGNG